MALFCHVVTALMLHLNVEIGQMRGAGLVKSSRPLESTSARFQCTTEPHLAVIECTLKNMDKSQLHYKPTFQCVVRY